MKVFKKSDSKMLVGIYLIYDPKLPDKVVKFSPPFFSPFDDTASSALLETLRRHSVSFDQLYSSEFRRMELWRIGSVDLSSGELVKSFKHRYRVCQVGEYMDTPAVRSYMQQVSYPSESEVEK